MALTLHSRRASPFGRKVLAAAAVLGISDSIAFLDAADEALLRSQNPLAKIPALILEDGSALFDSRVIVEYLDSIAGGGRIIPGAGKARFEALRTRYGDRWLVELTTSAQFYTFLCGVVNAFEVPIPEGGDRF